VDEPVASTAALTSLLVTMLWLLGCLARPYRPWKVVVVVSMAAVAALAYVLPAGRSFFAIAWDPAALGWGLLAGAIGAFVVEIAFRVSRRRVTIVEAGHHQPQPGELASSSARPLGTRPYTEDHRHRVPETRSPHDD